MSGGKLLMNSKGNFRLTNDTPVASAKCKAIKRKAVEIVFRMNLIAGPLSQHWVVHSVYALEGNIDSLNLSEEMCLASKQQLRV